MLLPLNSLPEGSSGVVELFNLEGTEIETVKRLNLEIGSCIELNDGSYSIDGKALQLSSEMASLILIRTQ